ncbi:arginine deiminase family protein, partial [Flavobacteriaceae bacterium]|nr:arginine deiminase family protein [Flavobacteriaceae bacterium]
MKVTRHSEYLKLASVYLKSAKNSYLSEEEVSEHWETLQYLSKPNFKKSLKEYTAFQTFFREKNISTCFFPINKKTKIDSIYCRDASIATDFGIIVCNMGKQGRIYEPYAQLEAYKMNNVNILGEIKFPGTLEGGDVAWLDQHTLAVGHTYRTNEEGISQLEGLLQPKGIEIIVVELPHYKGKSDVFHLMSILSPVDKNLAVVYSPLMPIKFRNELLERDFQLIEVPEQEFDSMGCNVLAVAPRDCLMVAGNPITKKLLEDAGA